jgi:Mor family transcriptional regulator
VRLVNARVGTMSAKPQIRASEIIQDIRSGMTYAALLEKYELSPNRIHRIFRGLIDGQVMTIDELAGRYTLFDDTVQDGAKSVRLLFRHVVNFALPICEKEKPKTLGVVLDITEARIGLKGIEAITGESKNLVIPANKFFDVAQVEFRAQCRWMNREESTGKCIGGFEITDISPRASVELLKLVQLIELANQVEAIECDESSPENTDRRKEERYTVGSALPVHEVKNRENKGLIVDVGEGGIRVKGLSVQLGERKTLVIPACRGFVTFSSIVMVAECRWIDENGEAGERNIGFKVIQLTPKSAIEWAKLIATLSMRSESDLIV